VSIRAAHQFGLDYLSGILIQFSPPISGYLYGIFSKFFFRIKFTRHFKPGDLLVTILCISMATSVTGRPAFFFADSSCAIYLPLDVHAYSTNFSIAVRIPTALLCRRIGVPL
jgi:hypothetical protein